MNLYTRVARFGSHKMARVIATVLLAAIVGVTWLVASDDGFSTGKFERLLQAHPYLGPIFFVMAHVAAAIAFLPCSPFTLIAGFLWPQPYALLLSIFAALCAASATFLLGRYLLPLVPRPAFLDTPLQRLHGLSANHGWRLVVLTYLNPALPSSTLGYAFGLSAISFRTYIWSAFLAMLPLQVALVALGSAAREVLVSKVWVQAGVFVALAVVALGLWLMLKRESGKLDTTERKDNDSNT